MAQPFTRSAHKIKPRYGFFRPSMARPEWRWFWTMALFADPMMSHAIAATGSGNLSGVWDFAGWLRGITEQTSWNASTINKTGRHRNWNNTTGDKMYYNANTSTFVPLGLRTYGTLNSMSLFIGLASLPDMGGNATVFTAEGGQGETQPENSVLFVNRQGGASATLTYIHEDGAGNNTSQVTTGTLGTTERATWAAVRNGVSKTIAWYKNGVVDTAATSYATQPDNANCYVGIMGRGPGLSGGTGQDGAVECCYLFKSALSSAQVRALHNDPWGPFRSASPRTAGGGGGGGGGTGVRSFVAGMIG